MPPVKDDVRNLTGPERAAALLLALGEDISGEVFKRLDEDEIKELSQQMARLGSISASVVGLVSFARPSESTPSD